MTTDITINDPIKKFRIGSVTATIWKNETQDGKSFYSTVILRSYRDDDGEWKETHSFGHAELMNVTRLAERAEAHIARLTA